MKRECPWLPSTRVHCLFYCLSCISFLLLYSSSGLSTNLFHIKTNTYTQLWQLRRDWTARRIRLHRKQDIFNAFWLIGAAYLELLFNIIGTKTQKRRLAGSDTGEDCNRRR